ncbi:MAG: hypothetical protein PVI33_03325 [Candidatus Omnitrophota bacterium]|jgi:hypothetical protein
MPHDYSGISFNSDGVCSYCSGKQHYGISSNERIRQMVAEKHKLKLDFERRLEQSQGKGEYDCIVPLSGGKDSCYLVYLLKTKYNLRILTFTMDNGLLNPIAKANVKQIIHRLEVDHVFVSPELDFFKRLYRYLILYTEEEVLRQKGYTNAVCFICNKPLLLGLALKEAVKREIPLVIGGLGPDQIRRYFYEIPREEIKQSWVPEWLSSEAFVADDKKYFWDPRVDAQGSDLPQVLFPFHVIEYPGPGKVMKEVVKLGFIKKNNISPRITNCHLCWLLVYLDRKRNFDPMVAEVSYRIRSGIEKRRQAAIALELSDFCVKSGLYTNLIRRKEITAALKFMNLKIKDLI